MTDKRVDCPICGTWGMVAERTCEACGGSGEVSADKVLECGVCEGDGEIGVACECHGRHPQYQCGRCGDGGLVSRKCSACGGSGETRADEWKSEEADEDLYSDDDHDAECDRRREE